MFAKIRGTEIFFDIDGMSLVPDGNCMPCQDQNQNSDELKFHDLTPEVSVASPPPYRRCIATASRFGTAAATCKNWLPTQKEITAEAEKIRAEWSRERRHREERRAASVEVAIIKSDSRQAPAAVAVWNLD